MLGERLGAYRIERELGSGGMGQVYAARVEDTSPGMEIGAVVALKVVHPHLLETPGFFKRFMREAQLGQAIRHENVVRTFDCDQELVDGKPRCFLVMEYVEGQTLSELLRELDRVPEELCRHVAREVSKGLSAIHDAGVVHRDLKPENVLITPDHVVKVMDLGVAKLSDESLRLSRTGAFVGSVEYAAPEQFKGGEVDGRTDLHALGVLLYELSSGAHPYRGDSFHEVLGRVCDEEPRRLGSVNPQLSAFYEELVHTLLVKDPRGRFASATRLLQVLDTAEASDWWRVRARSLESATQQPIRRVHIPRETAVYGRETETTRLLALYARAAAGDGQVVLIEGEAGIGKSRLVDELIARLSAEGEEMNFLFGSYPPGGAATADGAFSAAYREHFGERGSAPHLPENQVLVPAFDALLRGEGAPDGTQALTPGSLQTCFARATQSLAAQRTTIVLIDDLHFAPDEGRALFSSLASETPGHGILLIGTCRPGIPEEWRVGVTRLAHVSVVPLQRLGPKDLVALLADSLNSDLLAEELSGKIAVKSDGNPFFAFEIVRGLREGQFITQRADGTWASTQIIDEIQIPSSVLDLVKARMNGLDETERNLLDVAACWGYEFDASLIGEALGLKRLPVLQAMARIENRDRLVRASGRTFVFDHHQVQEALYIALPEMLREEYHAALAAALETRANAAENDVEELDGALCVDLCEHFLKGARADDAVRYLPTAQIHLARGYLHAHMASMSERALAVPGLLAGSERAAVLLHLAQALNRMGHRARQEECVREAELCAESSGDDSLRTQAATALGSVLSQTYRDEEAEAPMRRALDVARTSGDRMAEAAALVNLGNILSIIAPWPDARDCFERGLALSREVDHRRYEANALGALGYGLAALGRLDVAAAHLESALTIHRELQNRVAEAIALAKLGNVLLSLGRLSEARERQGACLVLARQIGSRLSEASALKNLGNVLHEMGETAEAEKHLLACLAISEVMENRGLTAKAQLGLGRLRSAEGNEAGARDALAVARDLAKRVGLAGVETLARCELALLPDGDAQHARATFTEHAERLSEADRQRAHVLLWSVTGDRAHLEEAKRLLDELLQQVPEENRESMLGNLWVNRTITAAWSRRDDAPDSRDTDPSVGPDDEPPRGTESATRIE